jgi:hypothetical protein
VVRNINEDATVGIHRPYFATTSQGSLAPDQVRAGYTALLQDMRTYLREMNVSERLAEDMLATEPEHVHELTQQELKSYGLLDVDPAERQQRAIENEVRAVQETKELGLDRIEYMRRKVLADELCGDETSNRIDCQKRILTTGQGWTLSTGTVFPKDFPPAVVRCLAAQKVDYPWQFNWAKCGVGAVDPATTGTKPLFPPSLFSDCHLDAKTSQMVCGQFGQQ